MGADCGDSGALPSTACEVRELDVRALKTRIAELLQASGHSDNGGSSSSSSSSSSGSTSNSSGHGDNSGESESDEDAECDRGRRHSSGRSSPASSECHGSAPLPHGEDLDHKEVSLVWQGRDDDAGPRRVYVGSEKFSRFRRGLDKFGIRVIVNCTIGAPNKFEQEPGFKYHNVELSDDNGQSILDKLPQAADFVHAVGHCENVLIHCTKGVSRSVSVFIAWLVRQHGLPLRHALFHTQKRRRVAEPNMGFMKQLLRFEELHLNFRSLDMDDFLPCPVCIKNKFAASQFSCGHRICNSCAVKIDPDAVCAHCRYTGASSQGGGSGFADGARSRGNSMEDISSWRTAMPPALGDHANSEVEVE